MDPYLISATLSPEDQHAVQSALDTLRQKLPFLIDLTSEDRQAIPKAADKTTAFVRKAVEICNEHPEMFPAAFLEEVRKDAELLAVLSPIKLAVRTLAKKLDDTTMQLGAETFAAARTVYTVTKAPFARAVLRTASDELAKRYSRRRKEDTAASSIPPATTNNTTA